MEKELKEKWISALRSGKYEQGKRHLSLDNCYCCLGVLLEVDQAGGCGKHYGLDEDHDEMLFGEELDRFGLSDRSANELARLNDGGCSFDEIADWIEDYV